MPNSQKRYGQLDFYKTESLSHKDSRLVTEQTMKTNVSGFSKTNFNAVVGNNFYDQHP